MTGRETAPLLPTLTGARGIAALAVLFYHIRSGMGGYLPGWVMDILAHGYLAVDLFFVLSGFVLWWNYGAQFREQGISVAPHFIIRRIARIFPLHIAILSAMALFALALVASGRSPGAQYDFSQLPAHFLLVQNWGFADRLMWNDPAWSISTEWAAYLLLAISGGWLARLSIGPRLFPCLTVALSVALGIWFAATERFGIGDDIAATGLLRCLVEFGLGILLCLWWSAQRDQARGHAIVHGTAAGLALVAAILWATGASQPAAVPIAMVAIVTWALQGSVMARPPLSGAVAQWLGDISYSVYLSHFFLWILFKLFFVDDPARVAPVKIAIFLALTLAVSHLLHRFLEAPGRRLFQRASSRLLDLPARAFSASRPEN